MEILVVVAVVALVASISIASIGSIDRVRLRGSCYLVAAAIQRGFTFAATSGESARLVIDLDSHTVTLERGEGRLLVDLSVEGGVEEPEEGEDEGDDEGGSKAGGKGGGGDEPKGGNTGSGMGGSASPSGDFDLGVETLSQQIRRGFHEGEVPRYKPPTFSPIGDKRFDGRELESGVEFVAVYSQLYPQPKESGKAYIYFYPDGMGDHAVIQLKGKSDQIYAVEVQPLTGKARIFDYPFVPDLQTEDEE